MSSVAASSFKKGVVQASAGHYSQAIEYLTGTFTQLFLPPAGYRLRAEAYMENDNCRNAVSDATTVLAIAPDDAWMLVVRGYCYAKQGHRQFAVLDYAAAAMADPNLGSAYRGLKSIAVGFRHGADPAVLDLDALAENSASVTQDDARYLRAMAFILNYNAEFRRAQKLAAKAVALEPESAIALREFGIATLGVGNDLDGRALASLAKALALMPEDPRASEWLGRAKTLQFSNQHLAVPRALKIRTD